MPEEKKPTEEQVEKPVITELEDGGLEVTVEEPKQKPQEEVVVEEDKKVKEQTKKHEPPKEDALRNKVFAQDRIINKLREELEQVKAISSSYQTPAQQAKTDAKLDELDELAQRDWKAAVNKLAEVKAREIYQAEQAKIREQQGLMQTQTELQNNVSMVINKYPELDSDPSSEKSVIFQSILEKNPSWRNNTIGPLLAMREMEDELRKRGYEIDGPKAEKEVERVVRANASTLAPSRPSPATGKVILTKEQKEFCDSNGMSYADYARTLKTGAKEGVTI